MKKILLSIVCSLLLPAMPCLAAKPEDTTAGYSETQRGVYTTPYPGLSDWMNTNPDFYHSHQIYGDERRDPLGVGIDLVVFQSSSILLEEVSIQSKYDLQNKEISGFLVGKVNLFKMVKNILQ